MYHIAMNRQYIDKKDIPTDPGIYIFRDKAKRPIYIGRATSLKDRIKSYFSADLLETRGRKIVEMVLKAHSIDFIVTQNVLEAIILEANEIKKYLPAYNTDLKDDKTGLLILITSEDAPRIILMREREYKKYKDAGTLKFAVKEEIGPFGTGSNIKEVLKIIRKIIPFRDEKSKDTNISTFYKSIGLAPEVNSKEEKEIYRQNIEYITKILRGEITQLKIDLEEKMNRLAREQKFEEANRLKKVIFGISHINDLSLIKDKIEVSDIKIEAYDISHTSGSEAVGSVVVYEDGQFEKSKYRKFIIRKSKNDDTANLGEIIFRRFRHKEWEFPDLIVIDGGKSQLNAVTQVLKALRIDIAIVAVTKDENHKAREILAESDIAREFKKKYKKQIISINAESHRFSISFHRQRRNKAYGV
jgi:excinuclease ABC subunit C